MPCGKTSHRLRIPLCWYFPRDFCDARRKAEADFPRNLCVTQMQPSHEPSTQPTPAETPILYRRGVQHDTNRSTERLRGKGVGELGADDARVTCERSRSARARRDTRSYGRGICTVGAGNLAPDHPDLGAADLLLALVDVGDLLAEVEATSTLARSALAGGCSGSERTWQPQCRQHPRS